MASKQLYGMTRAALRRLTAEKSKSSRFYNVSSHPLIVVVIGGLIGGLLTQYYTYRQKDLEFNRSFSNELNKISIQKFGEVWERIDENELAIDQLLMDLKESPHVDSVSRDEMVAAIHRLIHEDRVILSRHKFWVGEDLYIKTSDYLDINIRYGLNRIIDLDFSELSARRKAAKKDLLHTRNLYLLNMRNLFMGAEAQPQLTHVEK
jgi:hypothetical protein